MEEEIDLKSMLFYFLDRIKVIIKISLGVLIVGMLYFLIFNTPKFVSSSSITIVDSAVDISRVKTLTTTYSSSVKSNEVMGILNTTLQDDTDYRDIISVESLDDSAYINISVSGFNPKKIVEINSALDDAFISYINTTYNVTNLKVYSEATLTTNIVGIIKQIIKNIIIFAILGVICGCGYVFVRFYFDNTVKTSKDIEEKLKLKIFGVLSNGKSINNVISNIEIENKDSKVILLSEANDTNEIGEIIYDLSYAYASKGSKVLVLDAALNKSAISKLYSLSNEIGYRNAIENIKSLDKCILKTDNELLDVMTSGENDIDPVKVLTDSNNEKLIKELKDRYDIILINAPSVLGSNGMTYLAALSEVKLLVIKNEVTKLEDAQESIKVLGDNKLTGVIVSNVTDKSKNYPEYYKKYYYNK